MKLARLVTPLLLVLASCTGRGATAPSTSPPATGGVTASPLSGPVIRIGSFDFPESVLLAEIYGRALEGHGYRVSFDLNLGAREIVEPALQQGYVDFVPEYLGSALEFVGLGRQHPGVDVAASTRSLADVLSPSGVTVLDPAPAEDQNAIVVTASTAQSNGLRRVSDLARVASKMTFGGPPECPQRPFCLPGLRRVYGLRFKAFEPLDAGGPYTVAALERGDVQVALLFSTDGAISAKGFTVLRDDRGLQQAENVTPVVRDSVARAYGADFAGFVNEVSARLTTDELTRLNEEVADGRSPAAAAGAWLKERALGD